MFAHYYSSYISRVGEGSISTFIMFSAKSANLHFCSPSAHTFYRMHPHFLTLNISKSLQKKLTALGKRWQQTNKQSEFFVQEGSPLTC